MEKASSRGGRRQAGPSSPWRSWSFRGLRQAGAHEIAWTDESLKKALWLLMDVFGRSEWLPTSSVPNRTPQGSSVPPQLPF